MTNFNSIDLTKPLDPKFLRTLNHKELENLNQKLVERAVIVIGEISALKEPSKYGQFQFGRGMFNCEIEHDGKRVFKYTPEPRFAQFNFIIPGQWFQEKLDELDALRLRKSDNSASFPERKKDQLIQMLLGADQKRTVTA
jgi:hypothetical protein